MRDHDYAAEYEGCKYDQYFALTTTGEPIGLQEYCYRLSRNPLVHVTLFYDYQKVTDWKIWGLTAGHIDPAVKGKKGFNELDLIDKKDSQWFQFFKKCDIDSLSNYISKSLKSGKTAFKIPLEIDQAAGRAWADYREGNPEQIHLTVRSSQRGKTTLSTSLSPWN